MTWYVGMMVGHGYGKYQMTDCSIISWQVPTDHIKLCSKCPTNQFIKKQFLLCAMNGCFNGAHKHLKSYKSYKR